MLPARHVERARVERDDVDRESRTRLFDLSVGLVEDLGRHAARRDKSPEGFCSVFQVCLPYRGVFAWHVGGEEVIGDANQVLFVVGNESYRISNPFADGYGEVIFTPRLDVLSEMARANGTLLSRLPLFRRRRSHASARLQFLRARFLHWARSAAFVDALEAEEFVLAILRAAFEETSARTDDCGAATARLVRRTKLFLEAELANRILLADIGRAVGASPTYLTDVFRRVEGTSLHQYLTQLRLARALLELPQTNDLTGLALDVGFSSHSHFSAAFRRAFGCTPSQYRRCTGGPLLATRRGHTERHLVVDDELTHVKAPDLELTDGEPAHPTALQREAADGQTADGQRADGHRPDGERTYRARASGHGAD